METDDCAGIEELELPGPVREFIDRIPNVPFFRPQQPEEWMRIECFSDWLSIVQAACRPPYNAVYYAAYYGPREATIHAARDADRTADWDAAWDAAWDATLPAAFDAAWDAVLRPAFDAARNAARDAAWGASACAADYAAGLVVADLVDVTWLYRWWRAWELGYFPVWQDGDSLVVGCPRRLRRNDHR